MNKQGTILVLSSLVLSEVYGHNYGGRDTRGWFRLIIPLWKLAFADAADHQGLTAPLWLNARTRYIGTVLSGFDLYGFRFFDVPTRTRLAQLCHPATISRFEFCKLKASPSYRRSVRPDGHA